MNNNNAITLQQLAETLRQQLSETQTEWLHDAINNIRDIPDSQDAQLLSSAMTNRKLSAEVIQGLPGVWTVAEAARVLLLQAHLETVKDDNASYDAIWQAYRVGDENEKAAYIKGLSMLDPNGALLDIALHTGRTNNVFLFSALALHNTYPAKHYEDNAFEQLVLKTLFLGLSIGHIDSLQQRLSPALSNKCMDLVRERLAAERQPPVSIWLGIDIRHLDSENQALYLKFLEDPAKEHRYYSLLALKQLDLLESYRDLMKQLQIIETEPAILQLLPETTT